MISFLQKTRNAFRTKGPFCFVIGNESCDLDSAASALCLAYFHNEYQNIHPDIQKKNYIPVLNVSKRDYPLKTEVKYLFTEYSLPEEILIFRDELTDEKINHSEFILVDHHVSPFADRCIQIFDHRPLDVNASISKNCNTKIELVGSCATLIAEIVLNEPKLFLQLYEQLYTLLRSVIILDTVNFSKEAARATEKDHQICDALEICLNKLNSKYDEREYLFKKLIKARADISHLTAGQLLRKDMKILPINVDNELQIAFPGFPMRVQDFVRKPDAAEAIQAFALEYNVALIILMGMFVNEEDGTVERDIGLLHLGAKNIYNILITELLNLDNPKLDLKQIENCDFLRGKFFRQLNIKATRKQILPFVMNILANFKINSLQIDDC